MEITPYTSSLMPFWRASRCVMERVKPALRCIFCPISLSQAQLQIVKDNLGQGVKIGGPRM